MLLAKATKVAISQVVRQNEDDIRFFCHGGCSRMDGDGSETKEEGQEIFHGSRQQAKVPGFVKPPMPDVFGYPPEVRCLPGKYKS